MFYIIVVALAIAVVYLVLRDGVAEASTGWLILAWVAGVLALHFLATFILLANDPDWDDPDAPLRLGSLSEPIVLIAALTLAAGFALWLRRRAVLYVALPVVSLLAWAYSLAFR